MGFKFDGNLIPDVISSGLYKYSRSLHLYRIRLLIFTFLDLYCLTKMKRTLHLEPNHCG